VNKVWLDPEKLGAAGASFFSAGRDDVRTSARHAGVGSWTELRDRWEYSHVARAILATLAFVALAIALGA